MVIYDEISLIAHTRRAMRRMGAGVALNVREESYVPRRRMTRERKESSGAAQNYGFITLEFAFVSL